MTAAYTGLPGNEHVGWTFVLLVVAAVFVVWFIRAFREARDDRRRLNPPTKPSQPNGFESTAQHWRGRNKGDAA